MGDRQERTNVDIPTTTTTEMLTGFRGTEACHYSGITYRQLDYWARTGLVEPSVRPAHGSGTSRLYSRADVVDLALVKVLLDAGCSLQLIRSTILPGVRRDRAEHEMVWPETITFRDGSSVVGITIDLSRLAERIPDPPRQDPVTRPPSVPDLHLVP